MNDRTFTVWLLTTITVPTAAPIDGALLEPGGQDNTQPPDPDHPP